MLDPNIVDKRKEEQESMGGGFYKVTQIEAEAAKKTFQLMHKVKLYCYLFMSLIPGAVCLVVFIWNYSHGLLVEAWQWGLGAALLGLGWAGVCEVSNTLYYETLINYNRFAFVLMNKEPQKGDSKSNPPTNNT